MNQAALERSTEAHEGFIPAPERRREYKKNWSIAHREKLNEQNRIRYHANKARYRVNQRKYEKSVTEKARTDKTLHAKRLLKGARTRARRLGLEFSISYSDIPIPEFCPALGVRLQFNKAKMKFDSATIDRIDSSRGYVKGNVQVISLKANTIKSNASYEEILAVGNFLKERKSHE